MDKVIVGIGNPGKKYEWTRHNIGFKVIDKIAEKNGISLKKYKFHGLIEECIIKGKKILLVKPLTYVNNSGVCVSEIINYYKINIKENLIIIVDDFSIPLGKIRFRKKGRSGGHNGLNSIIKILKTIEFPRLRIGIKNNIIERIDKANFVLSQFLPEEKEVVLEILNLCSEAVEYWIENNTDLCMNKYNSYEFN